MDNMLCIKNCNDGLAYLLKKYNISPNNDALLDASYHIETKYCIDPESQLFQPALIIRHGCDINREVVPLFLYRYQKCTFFILNPHKRIFFYIDLF